jgi:PIN domain nuclease of toxin-antitoxin system
MIDGYLLDTCAVIWMTEDMPVDPVAFSRVNEAFQRGAKVCISPISAWEVGIHLARGRMIVAGPAKVWFRKIAGQPGITVTDLTADVLIASTDLPDLAHRDPADRIIIATAREFGLRIVTRDRLILDYAAKGHVLALAC